VIKMGELGNKELYEIYKEVNDYLEYLEKRLEEVEE